jgi:hypothetical protein
MRSLLLLTSTLPLVACSGSGHVTDSGDSIYTPDVRQLVLARLGGNLGPPPGTACDPREDTYTLTVAGHQLDWQYCEVTASGSNATYTPHTGSRALQAAEWSALQPELAALIVSDHLTCNPNDLPGFNLIVTTSAGDREYRDDFHVCLDSSQPYIVGDALHAALEALGALARQ